MEQSVLRTSGIASDSSFYIPPPPGGRTEDALAAVKKATEYHRASMLERHEIAARLHAATREYKAAVIKAFGEANWKELRRHSELQRKTNFGLGEKFVPRCADDFEKLAKSKQAAGEKTQGILKRAGVQPQTFEEINRRYLPSLEQIVPAKPQAGLLKIVPEEKVPLDIRNHTTNPWSYFYPPYEGSSWSYSWSVYGSIDLYRTENHLNGFFGQSVNHSRSGASDFEPSWLHSDQFMGFWYNAPKAGKLELWAILKASAVQIRFNLDWECCYSRAKHEWEGYFKVKVGGTEVIERIWREYYEIYCSIFSFYECDYSWIGYPICDQTSQEIRPNTTWWVYAEVPNIVAGWNWIDVGAQVYMYTFLNDYSSESKLVHYYTIPQVTLRVV